MRPDGNQARALEREEPSTTEKALDKRRGSNVVDGVVVQVQPHRVSGSVVQDESVGQMSGGPDTVRAHATMGRSPVRARRNLYCTDSTHTSGGARTRGH